MKILQYIKGIKEKIKPSKKEAKEHDNIEKEILAYEMAVDVFKDAVAENNLGKALDLSRQISGLTKELYNANNEEILPYKEKIDEITNEYAIATANYLEKSITLFDAISKSNSVLEKYLTR